jgi:hypothetical protein
MLKPSRFFVWLAVCVCAGPLHAAEFEVQSPGLIKGSDRGSGITFHAAATGPKVEVRIDLPGRKSALAVVDYETEALSLNSVATGTDRPVRLEAGDLSRLKILRSSLGPLERRTGDALASIVELLSEAPTGIVVDLRPARSHQLRAMQPRSYRSLCEARSATGRYDLDGETFTEEATGLGCYTSANECLGRCGAGCGDEPFGNPAAVQRITQECLNHDLCARANGGSFGDCGDEWNAAADGFLFAPDCGSLTGTWRDGEGTKMVLTQNSDEEVSGRINLDFGSCRYRISEGDHTGRTFSLSATRRESTPGCCRRLSYEGSIRRSCDTTRVEWTNSCNAEGITSFARD